MNITDLKTNQVAQVTAVTDLHGFESELRETGFMFAYLMALACVADGTVYWVARAGPLGARHAAC